MTDEQKLKWRFAEAWLRNPNNAYAAALSITKNNPFPASQICNVWLFDDEVESFKKALIEEHGEEHFLPSKAQNLHRIYDRANGPCLDENFVKLMKLAAEMSGHIEKPGLTINNNSLTNNNVMMIPQFPKNEDGTTNIDVWEASAIPQQKALTE